MGVQFFIFQNLVLARVLYEVFAVKKYSVFILIFLAILILRYTQMKPPNEKILGDQF